MTSVTAPPELEQPRQPAGIDLAYDFVLPSYQWALQRWEALDSRLHTLLAFATGLTVAGPTLAAVVNETVILTRPFWLALAVFGVLAFVGLFTRTLGTLVIIDPKILAAEWTGLSGQDFKLHMLDVAGEHAAYNQRRVNLKGHLVTAMTVLFLIEAALLTWWGTAIF